MLLACANRRHPQKTVQQGDLVLIIDKQLPRNEWLVGRLMGVHVGSDGLVCSFTMRTKNSELVCPIVKVSILEEVICDY